jgi:flagellar hook-length control protein FliK
MDANLNFLTAPTSNPTSVGPQSTTTGLDPNLAKPMSGQEFAGVMRDLMGQGERQSVAEASLMAVPSEIPATGLQTLNLGADFSVITTAEPTPDPCSLLQFARSQGLSESAVQALFGDLVTPAQSSSVADPKFGVTPASDLVVDLNASAASADLLGMPNLAQFGLASLPVKPSITLESSTLTLSPNTAQLGWIQAHPVGITPSTVLQVDTATSKATDLNAMLQASGASVAIQTVAGVDTKGLQTSAVAEDLAELPPELGPLDAMRMRMIPAWENMTRQLAKLNASDQTSAWGQLNSTLINSKLKADDAPEVLLDLGLENPDLLSSLESFSNDANATPVDSARQTAASGTLGAAATSAALAKPEMTDREAQIQDLADKLGKAMGERLQEQIEKGEWRLQLKLNPAHLGKIDVELGMKSGALDAVFKTDNPLTRELIAQGAAKLRDSLSDSGMTVANVWVNSENQRESARNSTPRAYNSESSQGAVSATESKIVVTDVKDVRSTDAWDTLA